MPRKIAALSAARCRAAKFDPKGNNKLSDWGGLYLEVTTGGKKCRFRYKQTNGKDTTLTLGI